MNATLEKEAEIEIVGEVSDFEKSTQPVELEETAQAITEREITKADTYKLTARQKAFRFFKATADFTIALIAILVLSPLFLLVAIAIKIDSPGPVFFKQDRIGKGGKLFKCVKFRSMAENARHDVAGYEYAEAASYVTRVGKIIRKLSIDELPQLFNMLTFKMSLIGYRP